MHPGTCTRVYQGYKYRVGVENSSLEVVIASRAVRMGSPHLPTLSTKKETKSREYVQHCYP